MPLSSDYVWSSGSGASVPNARSQKAVTPNDDADLPDGICAALLVAATGDVVFVAADDGGTNEIQTLTFTAATGGTFTLSFGGIETPAIDWTDTDEDLVADISDALNALSSIGAGGVEVAATTLSAGLGDVTVTFVGANLKRRPVAMLVVDDSELTGIGAEITVAETVAGALPGDEDAASAADNAVTWASQAAGMLIPVQARRVLEATTATVVALY